MATDFRDLLKDLEEFDESPLGRGFDLRLDLADIILRHLGEKGLAQKKLAELAGMKEPMITRLIHAASNCTFDSAGRVLFALGVKGKLIEVPATRGGTIEANTADNKTVTLNTTTIDGKEKENLRTSIFATSTAGIWFTDRGASSGSNAHELRNSA